VAAGIGLLAVLIAIATIRIRRQDLSGAAAAPQEPAAPQPAASQPAAPQPAASQAAAPQPGTVQRPEERLAFAAAARPCRFC